MEHITIGQIQVRTALTEIEKDEVEIVSVSQDKEGGSIQKLLFSCNSHQCTEG